MNAVSSSSPRILLADDHTLFRDALTTYIARAEPQAQVVSVEDLNKARDVLRQGPSFDMAMIDWHMPGVTGMSDIVQLAQDYTKTRFVIMSGVIDTLPVQQGLDQGLWGYFPKTLSGQAMIQGVRQVLRGERFVAHKPHSSELLPSNQGEKLFYQPSARDMAARAQAQAQLTTREHDALMYLVRGMTNAEIAEQMHIKEVTVKLHLSNAFDKIGARNRTEAALKCQQIGLFDHV
jgi:two-component system, NarL family, nitrate/nitrite response regulator NarL